MTTSQVPFGEARAQLRDLVCRAGYGRERITITRHGAPAAALVSLEDLRSLEALAQSPNDGAGAASDGATGRIEERIAIGGSLRGVWFAVARCRERARWWNDLILDSYVGGDAIVSWEERRGRVVDCVDGEAFTMVWGQAGESIAPCVEVRIDFVVDGDEVAVRVRQHGPGPAPEYWRERLAAWKDYVEGASAVSSESSASSVQP